MKLLILGLNYAPEKIGIAIYTAGMAEALVAMGHEVQVVAGRPYYPAWKIMDGHSAFTYARGREAGVDVTRVPLYVPKNPTGARRMLHHASFATTSFFPMLWRAMTWRPDAVLTIAPSLIGAPVAALAAKICGARSWLHIQDFEVEAAMATGLLSDGGRVAKIAHWFERKALGFFDMVSTISPQMLSHLHQKGVPHARSMELRNWADIDSIRPQTAPSPFRAEWNIKTQHVALYSGNIANKQGIEIVLAAAKALQTRDDLTFVICGDGPNRANVEAAAQGWGNIKFHGLQPKERLNDLLSLATIHLLPQLAGAADLVLPSKLTNMLASGRPVVATASPGTGLAFEVTGCGLLTEPGNETAFTAAIAALLDDPAAHALYSEASRRRAEERWHGKAILGNFERRLRELVGNERACTSSLRTDEPGA